MSVQQIATWVKRLRAMGKEAWVAGSITKDELPSLWKAGADVICVRGAACKAGKGPGRFGIVDSIVVAALVGTMR